MGPGTSVRYGGFTTGDIIRQKAQLLWRQLPQTRGSLGQSLANTGLRVTRRDIRSDYNPTITSFGEDASVPESAEDEMKALRTLAGDYDDRDI